MDALLSHQHDPTADAGACSATASSCLAVTSSNVPIITALLAGASLHLLLRPVHEIDQQALRLVAASTVAPATCFAALHWMRGLDVAAALWDTTVLTSSFAFGLLGSMLIYRAFFHRLCRFPGPFAARLSRFYALGHAAATKKSHRKLERLHEQYGDFVRTGACQAVERLLSLRALVLSLMSCRTTRARHLQSLGCARHLRTCVQVLSLWDV